MRTNSQPKSRLDRFFHGMESRIVMSLFHFWFTAIPDQR